MTVEVNGRNSMGEKQYNRGKTPVALSAIARRPEVARVTIAASRAS